MKVSQRNTCDEDGACSIWEMNQERLLVGGGSGGESGRMGRGGYISTDPDSGSGRENRQAQMGTEGREAGR